MYKPYKEVQPATIHILQYIINYSPILTHGFYEEFNNFSLHRITSYPY